MNLGEKAKIQWKQGDWVKNKATAREPRLICNMRLVVLTRFVMPRGENFRVSHPET